ncbi:efflux RND transporter periplasmic adaptor subunit [Paraliomyxa miuraensis]|uniref:efflux RND transporter periplasmic adaptor subunit n=1 Tax=Paraliomyxa miuraensis TaxID=376150 RepID=UPI0022575721|nr:HlyD family efflux transporter periplasmic adaptor subunit [Paraliomyxa miuraensis]MCX4246235.1 HlyD family efflux transporter periplasmic adaptor subunit [Paraliomyxa miuraensis]
MSLGRRAMVARSLGACLGLVLGSGSGCETAADEGERWVTVTRGALVVDVDVSGALRAVDSSAVSPPGLPGVWNYKIAMMAPEGAEIEKDQPLLAFDTSDLDRKLQAKQSERDSAAKQLEMKQSAAKVAAQDAALALAEAKAARRKAQLQAEAPPELTAVIELEKARLDLDLAERKVAYLQRKGTSARRADEAEIERWRSQRDRAEGRVAEITSSIEQMTMMAPRTGTVIYETDWQGQKKKVGDSTWRGDTVLQVASLAQMEAEGEVDEVDASRVAVGQPVSLRLDAQADLELRGTIREISPAVQRQSPDNPLKVIRLKIALQADEGARLRPGMRFRGHVETDRVDDALLVPLEAIVRTPEGAVAHRRSNGAGGFEVVPVVLGKRNAEQVEVIEGLAEGDEVDVAPHRAGREAVR